MTGTERVRWLVVLGVATAILVASVLDPAEAPADGSATIHAAAHLVGYAALALSLAVALAGRPIGAGAVAALATLAAVAYGFGIELLQAAIPARSFALADLLANAIGAGSGTIGWAVVARVRG